MVNKKICLFILCGMFLVICSYGIPAATSSVNITTPTNYSNYSYWIHDFNITFAAGDLNPTAVNATIYYNASGGWTAIGTLTTCSNSSTVGNCTGNLSIASIPEGKYAINATIVNASNSAIYANYTNYMITIDRSAPTTITYYNTTTEIYKNSMTLNITATDLLSIIDSVYFNVTNSSGTQELFNKGVRSGSTYSYYLNIQNLTNGNYTVTPYVNDTVNNTNSSSSIVVQIDNSSVPYIGEFVNTVDYGNYTTGIITLNVSVADAAVSSVYFNVSHFHNGTQMNWTKGGVSSTGSRYYNMSLDITNYPDGLYNVTIYANDTTASANNSESIRFRVDQTGPSVGVARSAYTRTSLTLAVSVVDASNITQVCTSSRSGATITISDGGSQVLTETGLSCSTSYSYIVSCTDSLGNTGSSTTVSYSTDACAGGSSSGGGGGGSTTSTWSHTYSVSDSDFGNGYTKQLASKERMTIKLGTQIHTIGVKSLTETAATIEISSNPVMITLDVGGEAKVDLDEDGYYDLKVNLLGITNNKADVKILKIYQEVPEGGEAVSTTGEVTPITPTESEENGESEENVEKGTLRWWFIIIGAIVVIAIVVAVVKKKK
ncbi:MAG: hypothetical protein ABH811_00430 [archaeon]